MPSTTACPAASVCWQPASHPPAQLPDRSALRTPAALLPPRCLAHAPPAAAARAACFMAFRLAASCCCAASRLRFLRSCGHTRAWASHVHAATTPKPSTAATNRSRMIPARHELFAFLQPRLSCDSPDMCPLALRRQPRPRPTCALPLCPIRAGASARPKAWATWPRCRLRTWKMCFRWLGWVA